MNPLNHVAIIMDGNGRWGLKYKNSRSAGHKAGLKTVEKIIEEIYFRTVDVDTLFIRGEESNYILEADFPDLKKKFPNCEPFFSV